MIRVKISRQTLVGCSYSSHLFPTAAWIRTADQNSARNFYPYHIMVSFGIWVRGAATIFCDHPGPCPYAHHHASSAHPPRCLTRCKWNFLQTFITSRTSASRALERSSVVSIAISEPFLSRSWDENSGKLGFWAAVRSFLAPHDLKSVLARRKWAENAFKAPCCRSSPFVVVVWR
jgi:hypothetical protein